MAARFFVNGGVDNNWGTTGNWSLTSGGAGGQTVPTTSDDVTFDTNSPNCTLNTSARVCKSLTCTNYTNTLTFTNTLSVSGAITLGASMGFAGSSALIPHAAGTLTSNGKTISVPLTFDLGVSYTLADNWNTTSDLTMSATSISILGSKTITVGGSFAITAASAAVSATGSTIILNGTGNLSSAGATFNGNITFNTAGTITQTTNFLLAGSPTITYTAGTVDTSGGFDLVLQTTGVSATLNTSGMNWYRVKIVAATSTVTLTSNLNITGTGLVNTAASGTCTINGAFNVNTVNFTTIGTNTISGTATIVVTGGTLSQSGSATIGGVRNNLSFAGNVTISGGFCYGTGVMTYTSGTVDATGSIIYIVGSCTLNTAGIVWDSITISASAIITNNSLLSVTKTSTSLLNITGSTCNFVGTSGFTVSAFRMVTPSTGLVLKFGNTYTIVNAIDFVGYTGATAQIASDTPGSKVVLNLTAGITQLISAATITDVNSSGGTAALVYQGILSNTTNWTDMSTQASNPFIKLRL